MTRIMEPVSKRASRRRLWRALAAVSLPALLALWALWSDLYMLDASGLSKLGGPQATNEWMGLSLATVAIVASFWVGNRAVRVLGYTLHSLVLSVGFALAVVLAVMHAFGGPQGDLTAPAWALAALGVVAALCVLSLLATAALIVEDVRAGDAEGS